MPSAPGVESLFGFFGRSAVEVIRRCKFPSSVFTHQKRKVLRVVVAFICQDVERHAPEHLLLCFISKPEIVDYGEDVVVGTCVGAHACRKVCECSEGLDMVSCLSVAVEAPRHEVLEAVQLVDAAFAGCDSGSTGLLHDFVFTPSAIGVLRWRELDDPMLEPIWQVAVAGEKLVRFPIPAHDGLGLSSACGNAYSEDLPKGVIARHLFKRSVERFSCLFRQLAHVKSKGFPAMGTAFGLIAKRTYAARANVRETVQSGD